DDPPAPRRRGARGAGGGGAAPARGRPGGRRACRAHPAPLDGSGRRARRAQAGGAAPGGDRHLGSRVEERLLADARLLSRRARARRGQLSHPRPARGRARSRARGAAARPPRLRRRLPRRVLAPAGRVSRRRRAQRHLHLRAARAGDAGGGPHAPRRRPGHRPLGRAPGPPARAARRRPRLPPGGLGARAGAGGGPMTPALLDALRRASYIYLTTYSASGKSGTVPTWLWLHDDLVYFTTQRASLKARRIHDNGRVTVRVGKKDGPAFEGRAEWVDER